MTKFFRLLLVTFFAFIAVTTYAMTDDEVMQYAIEEYQKGTSQTEIATKLLQKGATVTQLKNVRDKYQQIQSIGSTSINVSAEESVQEEPEPSEQPSENTTERVQSVYYSSTKINEQNEDVLLMKSLMELPSYSKNDSLALLRKYLEIKAKKKVYGRDIFNNEDLSFEPNKNLPAPVDYQLGPDDQLTIEIYGASQKSINAKVSSSGFITVANVGPISVGGLTLGEAQKRISDILSSRFSGSQFNVTLGSTSRTIVINVMGEVLAPGTYTLSPFASVFHALYSAGGVNNIGSLRHVCVYRDGQLVGDVDLYEFIFEGKTDTNIRLADNDVIVVGAYEAMVSVMGRVRRPMYYEMKPNETVANAIKYAGGFTGDAYTQSIRLMRKNGREYSVFNLSEDDFDGFQIADGDSIAVDSILTRYTNTVELRGAVFRPGMYRLSEKITSVKTLIDYADGVTEKAFTGRAVLHRMKPDRRLEVVSIDLDGILNGTSPDVPLQENDVLFVPTRQDYRADQTLTIEGEVQYPGIYKYAEGETLEDFILQAGGLIESSSTVKVDVARRVGDPTSTEASMTIAETFSFALKDGFVVDGEQNFTLEPFDVVYVRQSPTYSEQKHIYIAGEVVFPGIYVLSQKDERISDVIKRAGGVTNMAYVEGTCLIRKMTDAETRRQNSLAQAAKSQNIEDTDEQIVEQTHYSVGINLKKALDNPGGKDDIILRELDVIRVPTLNKTVKVGGNVLYPNAMTWESGKKAKFYIDQAGGYGVRSKKNKTFVTYMNGSAAKAKKATIEPGSEIFVPARMEKLANNAQQWIAIGSSIAGIASVIAAICVAAD